jgi:hypothetical protein
MKVAAVVTLASLVSARKHNQEPTKLKVKPVKENRNGFKPFKFFRTRYENYVASVEKKVTCDITMETKLATVNFDNIPQIEKVTCLGGNQVDLKFSSEEAAAAAFADWVDDENWAVMLGYQHDCLGYESLDALEVKSVLKGKSAKEITIKTELVDLEKIGDEYEIVINQMPVTDIEKREFKKGIEKTWNLDLNYDRKTSSVKQSSLVLLDNKQGYAHCIDCHATGSLTLGAKFKASLLSKEIVSYQLYLNGGYKANVDFKLGFKDKLSKLDFTKNLFELNLPAVAVPAWLSFDAGFDLDATMAFKTAPGLIEASYGMDVDFPFSYSIDGVNFKKPVVTKTGKPVLKEHDFLPKSFAVTAEGHLIPKLDLSFQFLAFPKLSIGLALDSGIIANVIIGDDAKKCSSKSFYIEMNQKHVFNFFTRLGKKSTDVTLYKYEGIAACFFCDKCFPQITTSGKSDPTNAIVTTTTVAGTETTTVAGTETTTAAGTETTTAAGTETTTAAGTETTTAAGTETTTAAGTESTTTVGGSETTYSVGTETTVDGTKSTTTVGGTESTSVAGTESTTTVGGTESTSVAGTESTTTVGGTETEVTSAGTQPTVEVSSSTTSATYVSGTEPTPDCTDDVEESTTTTTAYVHSAGETTTTAYVHSAGETTTTAYVHSAGETTTAEYEADKTTAKNDAECTETEHSEPSTPTTPTYENKEPEAPVYSGEGNKPTTPGAGPYENNEPSAPQPSPDTYTTEGQQAPVPTGEYDDLKPSSASAAIVSSLLSMIVFVLA